ncbi:MAG: response regulator [Deltaproteobacteria bacterium]|nr:response regulator [Deltaproteobacteria bacterium]MBI2500636.1 response regulator [Deltaproteobacteria bacterium]
MEDLSSHFGRPPRVLIADDNVANVELIRMQLKSSGYELDCAYDGQQTLDKVSSFKPDIILLDLMMPVMTGYEVCQTLKSDKELRFIPIIIVTALQEMDDKLKAIELGADDFLIKPFNRLELATRIRSLLRMKSLYDDLERSENILVSLAQAIEAKDLYTRGHSERVARYSRQMAISLGLSEREQNQIWRGGLMHDIGKIGIREEILHKPGPLTSEEMEHVRTHPLKGYEICCKLKSITASLPVIKNHHERFDGEGHPDRMGGEKIPLFARISAIADSYDAMTTNRPYRKAMRSEEALAVLDKEKNWGQWDPTLVTEFIKVLRNGVL